jgi:hypothetical protein
VTTGSGNNGGSRLDRIEELLSQTAIQTALNAQAIASNARAIEANSNANAENAEAISSLREVVLNFVDGIQVMNQRIDGHEDRFTEIVGQVRDLQVHNSRILDRLEGLEGRSGQR